MAGKGLGAGLGALFGESAVEPEEKAGEFLPISQIEPRDDQPRRVFDQVQLAQLADSIREHGVIQPITVRAIDSGYYQIIAGERRWRAARLAGLSEVPVRIVEADDKTAMILAMVENLQREDLNPIEEARGYKTLIDEYKMTQAALAESVGKSRPVITNSMRLLTLPDEVIKLTEDGELSLSQARAILEIEDDSAKIEIAKLAAENGLTVRQIGEMAAKNAKKKGKSTPKRRLADDGVDYYAEVEKTLSDALGRRVRIVCGRKKGKIEIEYYDEDDFEEICSALSSINTDK